MTTSEARLKILRMIQEGKITPEEGMDLLQTLEETQVPPPSGPASVAGKATPRWLRIRVTDTHSGKIRVNVRLPLNVVTTGLKMGARFSPEIEGVNMSQITEFIRNGQVGQVVDMFDDVEGEHVEMFLE